MTAFGILTGYNSNIQIKHLLDLETPDKTLEKTLRRRRVAILKA
jgi:hypothetical protein